MSEEATQQTSEQCSAVDILIFDDSRLRTCQSDEGCDNVIGKEIPPELLKELDDSEEEEAKKKKCLKKFSPPDHDRKVTKNKNLEKQDKNMNQVNGSDNVLGKEIPPELLKELEDSDEEEPKKEKNRSKAGKTSAANDKGGKDMKKKDADNTVAKPSGETGIERALELAVRQQNSITRRMKTQKRKSVSSKKARRRHSVRQEIGRKPQPKKAASKENMSNVQKKASSRKRSSKRKKN